MARRGNKIVRPLEVPPRRVTSRHEGSAADSNNMKTDWTPANRITPTTTIVASRRRLVAGERTTGLLIRRLADEVG
jgi:hypothetical protein